MYTLFVPWFIFWCIETNNLLKKWDWFERQTKTSIWINYFSRTHQKLYLRFQKRKSWMIHFETNMLLKLNSRKAHTFQISHWILMIISSSANSRVFHRFSYMHKLIHESRLFTKIFFQLRFKFSCDLHHNQFSFENVENFNIQCITRNLFFPVCVHLNFKLLFSVPIKNWLRINQVTCKQLFAQSIAFVGGEIYLYPFELTRIDFTAH